MSYSDFTLEAIERQFGVTTQEAVAHCADLDRITMVEHDIRVVLRLLNQLEDLVQGLT